MIYSDVEKQIYTSPIGTKHDPIHVCNLMTAHSQGNWNRWVEVWSAPDSTDEERAKAALEIALAARKSFGWKLLTQDGGVAEGAVLEAVEDFMGYLAKKA